MKCRYLWVAYRRRARGEGSRWRSGLGRGLGVEAVDESLDLLRRCLDETAATGVAEQVASVGELRRLDAVRGARAAELPPVEVSGIDRTSGDATAVVERHHDLGAPVLAAHAATVALTGLAAITAMTLLATHTYLLYVRGLQPLFGALRLRVDGIPTGSPLTKTWGALGTDSIRNR